MTLDQIVEETRQLPREQVAELVDELTLRLHQGIDPVVENAWREETSRRMEEIIEGKVQGIPMEQVSESIRAIVGR
jgi:putative addiction module component (TIGR02574 family)